MPLDNLSRKPPASAKKSPTLIDSNTENIQKHQSAQILVPSALNFNTPLQPSLAPSCLGKTNWRSSDNGNY